MRSSVGRSVFGGMEGLERGERQPALSQEPQWHLLVLTVQATGLWSAAVSILLEAKKLSRHMEAMRMPCIAKIYPSLARY